VSDPGPSEPSFSNVLTSIKNERKQTFVWLIAREFRVHLIEILTSSVPIRRKLLKLAKYDYVTCTMQLFMFVSETVFK